MALLFEKPPLMEVNEAAAQSAGHCFFAVRPRVVLLFFLDAKRLRFLGIYRINLSRSAT
jgi:hypothetical protein